MAMTRTSATDMPSAHVRPIVLTNGRIITLDGSSSVHQSLIYHSLQSPSPGVLGGGKFTIRCMVRSSGRRFKLLLAQRSIKRRGW